MWQIEFVTQYKNTALLDLIFENYNFSLGNLQYDGPLSISATPCKTDFVEIDPDDSCVYSVIFEYVPDLDGILRIIKTMLESSVDNGMLSSISLNEVEEKDWVAINQKISKPIFVGKFGIFSSEMTDVIPSYNMPEGVRMVIDPDMAFGTGAHETTQLCIEAMCFLYENNMHFRKIADIGTGSGILAIAAHKLWHQANIIVSDIDEKALTVAKRNFIVNESKCVVVNNDDIFSKKYDLIVSNILFSTLTELSSMVVNACAEGAYIILSGFIDKQLGELEKIYTVLGFERVKLFTKNKWCALLMIHDKAA